MAGVFDLKEPADLLEKMGRKLERMRAAPNDEDFAFNFFVTAEHMIDWLYPGEAGKAQRSAEHEDPLLGLVSELANRAKHFDKLFARHQSVAVTAVLVRHPHPMMQRILPSELSVVAGGKVGKVLGGSRITALALAERVYQGWEIKLRPRPRP